jgi:hypothetical protein
MSVFAGYYDPILRMPPGLFGFPLGIVVLIAAVGLTALGVRGIWYSNSRARSVLAFAFLTVPATALVVLTPAMILIVINLTP